MMKQLEKQKVQSRGLEGAVHVYRGKLKQVGGVANTTKFKIKFAGL